MSEHLPGRSLPQPVKRALAGVAVTAATAGAFVGARANNNQPSPDVSPRTDSVPGLIVDAPHRGTGSAEKPSLGESSTTPGLIVEEPHAPLQQTPEVIPEQADNNTPPTQ